MISKTAKKIILIFLILIVIFSICGCEKTNYEKENAEDNRFSVIFRSFYEKILKDNRTGVQYLISDNGGVCALVDKDGKPYIDYN